MDVTLSANFPKLPDEIDVPLNKSVTGRIMNGVPTKEPLPYQLRIENKNDYSPHHCGATLISPSYAITAYHCLSTNFGDDIPDEDFIVYAGAYELLDKNAQKRGVRRSIPINMKNGTRWGNLPDIALLWFDEPFDINEFVTPACLPTKEAPVNEECIVSGWGGDGTFYPPSVLHAATIRTTKLEYCKQHFSKKRRIDVFDICAYHPTRDACGGDSGGPLVCKTNGGATLYGVVSYGKTCYIGSTEEKFGLYANVFYFIDQIKEVIGAEDPCPINDAYYGDQLCDGNLNNSENCFDGGDCCGDDADYRFCHATCSPDTECICKCRA